jgi:hypothetical protein
MSYRRLQRVVIVLLTLYVPVLLGFGYLCSWILHNYLPAYILSVAWILALMFTGGWWLAYKCPHCGTSYFGRTLFRGRCPICKNSV